MIRTKSSQSSIKRWIVYPCEAATLWLFFAAFKMMPLVSASRCGGVIFGLVGRLTKKHRVMMKNLALAFPESSEKEREKTATRVWRHLGEIFAQFPHLKKITSETKVEGLEHLVTHGTCLIFSGHLGNWEILPGVMKYRGVSCVSVYREANNPISEKIIMAERQRVAGDFVPKGSTGARQIIQAIKNKVSVMMLTDQKMNEGIAVPFFGHPAMTAPAIAALSIKYQLPLIPLRIFRDSVGCYRIKIFPPLAFISSEIEIMAQINKMLEEWIRETPDQWLWIHNRWPK